MVFEDLDHEGLWRPSWSKRRTTVLQLFHMFAMWMLNIATD